MELVLGEVATILRSRSEIPETAVRHYSIDSRTLVPGSLFFAIRGPRFDGHDFVGQAIRNGAAAAVVEAGFRDRAPAELRPHLIPVAEVPGALQQLACAVRRKWGCPIIGVTGSTGKTTTKELIAAVVGTRFAVHKSQGNFNNQYGLPLALLALESSHEVAVVELGMSHAGEIAALARLAEPQIGVVTNVAPVHLKFFDSLDGIARAKRELVENLATPATAILNFDDPRVRRFSGDFTGRVLTFGFDSGADFQAVSYRLDPPQNGPQPVSRFRVRAPGETAEMLLSLPGRHSVSNALAALAVGGAFGVGLRDAQPLLRNFSATCHRMDVKALANGALLIDDSYNSNPRAMEQMLETLREWPGARRRIMVAGEMLELGPSSLEWHRAVGRRCAAAGLDWLIGVQGDARLLVEAAVAAGFEPGRARFFEDAAAAGALCRTLAMPGDAILIKGSRGVHLERVGEMLLADDGRPQSAIGTP